MPDTIVQAIVAKETMYFYLQTQISPEFGAQRCQSDKLLVEEFHFSFGRNHKLIVFGNFDIDVKCGTILGKGSQPSYFRIYYDTMSY